MHLGMTCGDDAFPSHNLKCVLRDWACEQIEMALCRREVRVCQRDKSAIFAEQTSVRSCL